jgi:hypothetical protein
MPFLSPLSRGHDRSSLYAAVSVLHSFSKFPIALLGTILFVALAVLGMSGRALAAVTYVTTASYSASGEVSEVDGTTLNKTDIDVQNSASNSTSGKSSSVSLLLNNKQATVGGATGDASARVHAGIGALGVEAFASAAASTYTAEAGIQTEASASFSDAFTFGWNDPKNFGKPVIVQSNILLDGGFTHSNVYEFSPTFPTHEDYVSSLTISELFMACTVCGALANSGLLGKSTHIDDSASDPGIVNEDDNPPKMLRINMTVPSGVAIPIALTLDVRSAVSADNRDHLKSFTGEAVADAAFTKTLALGPLTFIDPSTGLALSESDFSLVSDSGYDYLHPPAVLEPPAVPEPPIYALLLCGLLAMWVTVAHAARPHVILSGSPTSSLSQ